MNQIKDSVRTHIDIYIKITQQKFIKSGRRVEQFTAPKANLD